MSTGKRWSGEFDALLPNQAGVINPQQQMMQSHQATPNHMLMSLLNDRKRLLFVLLSLAISLGFIFLITGTLSVSLFLSISATNTRFAQLECGEQCSFGLAESIPEQVTFNFTKKLIFDTWHELISNAQISIDIASYYWSLNNTEPLGNGSMGNSVLAALIDAGKRGVKIRIAQNLPSSDMPDDDTAYLVRNGLAEVVNLNFTKILGAGILHTKFLIIDEKHAHVGSANMDWRSLAQVKELGITVTNCPCVTRDLSKIFEVYWAIGKADSQLPMAFPQDFNTMVNEFNQMQVTFNATYHGSIFISSAPPPFSTNNRADDMTTIINAMRNASKYIYVEVMDFTPALVFSSPRSYWGDFFDTLLNAVINRNVDVRLLIAKWDHTSASNTAFLSSLSSLSNICNVSRWCHGSLSVQNFVVPPLSDGRKYPYTRVNHAKFMVTDKTAYIGTSNWSQDYFVNTAGVGFVSSHAEVVSQLKDVFLRDWNSQYTQKLKGIDS